MAEPFPASTFWSEDGRRLARQLSVRLTGIGRSTLYEFLKSGEIETVKVGRSTLIPQRCLKKLVGG